MDCIFCKIINKEIKSDIVFEDKNVIVFKDINPKASVHLLILLKKHIESINHISQEDKELAGELLFTVQKIAKENKAESYKIVINNGRKAGQTVDHLHLHFLSGQIKELP